MGWSAGFTFVNVGGVGLPCGKRRADCVMAACTSTAAPSRLLLSANSRVIWVEPSEVVDVMESKPAMFENWFSSGGDRCDWRRHECRRGTQECVRYSHWIEGCVSRVHLAGEVHEGILRNAGM